MNKLEEVAMNIENNANCFNSYANIIKKYAECYEIDSVRYSINRLTELKNEMLNLADYIKNIDSRA